MVSIKKFLILFCFPFVASVALAAPEISVKELIEKKSLLNQNFGKSSQDRNILTKGHVDPDLLVTSFRWNNGSVKNISLDSAKELAPQYEKALDSYFVQIAQSHGATKITLSDAKRVSLHNTSRGAIIGKYQQQVRKSVG